MHYETFSREQRIAIQWSPTFSAQRIWQPWNCRVLAAARVRADSLWPVTTHDGVRAGHCDGRVAASNAPRKCPGGKGWIGGGAQASSLSYRRFDARAEGEKRISLSVVVEAPVGVERECEYKRVFSSVISRMSLECISQQSKKNI